MLCKPGIPGRLATVEFGGPGLQMATMRPDMGLYHSPARPGQARRRLTNTTEHRVRILAQHQHQVSRQRVHALAAVALIYVAVALARPTPEGPQGCAMWWDAHAVARQCRL